MPAKGRSGGKGKSSASRRFVTKAARAGLQFPVGRIARFMKQGRHAERVGARCRCRKSRVGWFPFARSFNKETHYFANSTVCLFDLYMTWLIKIDKMLYS